MKVGYVRVSTIEQNEERQIVELRKNGVEKFFVDKVSAKSAQRPKFDEMMNFFREGDELIVTEFSRLARSTVDLLNIVETLTKKDVKVRSLKEQVDFSTPQGKFMLTIFGAIAEFERELILQRQREGIQLAKAAVDKQTEIDFLQDKINTGIAELNSSFPQQDEFEQLSFRSSELSRLLNSDLDDSSKRDEESLKSEKERRINCILDGYSDSLCEKTFFSFAKIRIVDINSDWSATLDKTAITFLVDKDFPKDTISNTILKCSPSVPSKEDVYNMVEDCTRCAASCR